MGFIHVAVAVLGLLSVGQSAPVTSCQSLTQPLEIQGREQLLGKWLLVAESTNIQNEELLKKTFLDSSLLKITAANESDAINFISTSKAFGFCMGSTVKMTMENNALQPALTNVTLTQGTQRRVYIFLTIYLLKTGCSDCLLFRSLSHVSHTIMLLSKRRSVTAAELDEFKKQAECLNLPPPFTLKPEGDVCPEPFPVTDDPPFFVNGQSVEFANITRQIIDSFGGPEKLVEKISEALSKQD